MFEYEVHFASTNKVCREIVTEDLNPDQTYRCMAVVNPFK